VRCTARLNGNGVNKHDGDDDGRDNGGGGNGNDDHGHGGGRVHHGGRASQIAPTGPDSGAGVDDSGSDDEKRQRATHVQILPTEERAAGNISLSSLSCSLHAPLILCLFPIELDDLGKGKMNSKSNVSAQQPPPQLMSQHQLAVHGNDGYIHVDNNSSPSTTPPLTPVTPVVVATPSATAVTDNIRLHYAVSSSTST
jgi:hypothetical protein